MRDRRYCGAVVMTDWELIALLAVVVWGAAVFKHRRWVKAWVRRQLHRGDG